MTTTTKLTGQAAVDHFFSHRPEATRLKAQCRTPNGGWHWGETTYVSHWLGDDPADLLGEFDLDAATDGAELDDDGDLNLWSCPAAGVHKYATLTWAADPLAGKRIVACFGAHYGSAWGASTDDADTFGLPSDLETQDVLSAITDLIHDDDLAEAGLESLIDPTDDGCNYAVADESRFLAWARKIAEASEDI